MGWLDQAEGGQEEEQKQFALGTYWERWFAKESRRRQGTRGIVRWTRDESLKWEGEGYGIKHQPWAQGSVERITAGDFEDYWAVLGLAPGATKAEVAAELRKRMWTPPADRTRPAAPPNRRRSTVNLGELSVCERDMAQH